MALLKLDNIGKIYVSDGNVSVGIRGVDLSFDRGEFVAVTGKSGSGKSTLLNVISGMDTYEEGEMFIEGQPTSHYLQPEWEDYRKKYISFIFQDYNIIESFTVLENVELALMHIDDKKERRRRALELLNRVGLASHVHHKGSKLSGGQKQRTVIARALAKDSPIILADEPTGNLDSATSAEIIELLREVSKDKLLIVVTHNFEQVEKYATRHIRVFDGAVEFDHSLGNSEKIEINTVDDGSMPKVEKKKKSGNVKNGLILGKAVFTSKPKLSVFLCLLLVIGSLGVFFMTSFCGDAMEIFDKHYMFEHMDGRVVLTRQDGSPISESEIKELADEYGADSYLKYDILLDKEVMVNIPKNDRYYMFNCTYKADDTQGLIGEMPEAENEVMLRVPISYKTVFGTDPSDFGSVFVLEMELDVVGVCYYADNNITPMCVFTEEGFTNATAVYYLCGNSSPSARIQLPSTQGMVVGDVFLNRVIPSYGVEEGKIFIYSENYRRNTKNSTITVEGWYYNGNDNTRFGGSFDSSYLAKEGPEYPTVGRYSYYSPDQAIAIHPSLIAEMVNKVLDGSYRQASLFMDNDKQAKNTAALLKDDGYIAVLSDTTYTPDSMSIIESLLSSVLMAILWVVSILFISFFINLCTGRAVGAFKGDMAIMRSMGIPVSVIRIAMYVRMLIALVPAIVAVVATAMLVFTVPQFNAIFKYLYAWQYAVIFVGLILLTVNITRKQIKKLFSTSVKKSLRGGAAND